jgi:hypothetical protein
MGVILFELLTGERPFRGHERMLVVQILRDVPPRPRSLNSRIPRDLETIVLKCLHKDPKDRYDTAAELADDLRRWLGGQGISARPPGAVARLANWCLSYERIKLAGTFSLLLLALFELWQTVALVSVLVGQIRPPDPREAALTFGGLVFVAFPISAWVSYRASQARVRALWAGLGVCVCFVTYCVIALSGVAFQAGGFLDDLTVRIPIISISLMAAAIALVLYVISICAYYANRDVLAMQASSTRSERTGSRP